MYTANEAHVVTKRCCMECTLLNRNIPSTAMTKLCDGQSAKVQLSLSVIPGKAACHIQQGKPIRKAEVFGKGINVIN